MVKQTDSPILLEEILGNIWKPCRQMTLILMEDNKIMVQLFHKGHMERILQGSPWLIDNNMFILKKAVVGEDSMATSMNTTHIWVQVHQIPFDFMDTTIIALVEIHIDKMVKYDEENNYDHWRKYMKIRVGISIEEPLKQDLIIECDARDNTRLMFKYEKLGKFCFIMIPLDIQKVFVKKNMRHVLQVVEKCESLTSMLRTILPAMVKWRASG